MENYLFKSMIRNAGISGTLVEEIIEEKFTSDTIPGTINIYCWIRRTLASTVDFPHIQVCPEDERPIKCIPLTEIKDNCLEIEKDTWIRFKSLNHGTAAAIIIKRNIAN